MAGAATPDPYDVEAASPGFAGHLARYRAASQATRERMPARLDLAYGTGAAERLDVFPASSPRAPALVFLHGGGWRASSKSDRSFPADVFVPAGATWISVEYPLAPGASLDDMVGSVRRAIAWVHAHAAGIGVDPDRVFVCGNSAGGHLAGMALATDWPAFGAPAGLIKGATTISGVFGMTPLLTARPNDWLRMDLDAAVRNSPVFNLPAQGCPLLCAVGSEEPPAFVEQSAVFAAAWRNRGHAARFMPMEGHDHFSVIGELGRPESPLVAAMLEQLGLRGPAGA